MEKGQKMASFEIGKEYWARFWNKHDLLVGCKVLKKTEKTILVEMLPDGEQKRYKLSNISEYGEMFTPCKSYTFFAKDQGNWIKQRQKEYYGE